MIKSLILFITIAFIGSFDLHEIEQQNSTLVGSSWASQGDSSFPGDTLKFRADKEVDYYMGDLDWVFRSTYELTNDILTIRSKTQAFEVNDVSGLSPNLLQKYQLTNDSLQLIYLANRRFEEWIEASEERYKVINNFYRLE